MGFFRNSWLAERTRSQIPIAYANKGYLGEEEVEADETYGSGGGDLRMIRSLIRRCEDMKSCVRTLEPELNFTNRLCGILNYDHFISYRSLLSF